MKKFLFALVVMSLMFIGLGSASATHESHILNIEVKHWTEFNTYDHYKQYRYSVFDVEDNHAESQQEVYEVEQAYYEDINAAKVYFDNKK